jgi:hypothetical protein
MDRDTSRDAQAHKMAEYEAFTRAVDRDFLIRAIAHGLKCFTYVLIVIGIAMWIF